MPTPNDPWATIDNSAAMWDQIDQAHTQTSTLTPAQSARQHLANKGLTPEMVKLSPPVPQPTYAGDNSSWFDTGIVRPDPNHISNNLKSGGSFMKNAGTMLNPFAWIAPPMGELLQNTNPQSTASYPAKYNEMDPSSPEYNPTAGNLQGRLLNSIIPHPIDLAKEAYSRGEQGKTTSDLYAIPATMAASIGLSKMLPKIAPEGMPKTSANLINRWLGKGAVDEVLNKNAGRGISKSKIVAATADGVQEGVKSELIKWQGHKQKIMDTPLSQAPTIDGPKLIQEAFGEPPLNIPRTTLEHWNEFAANIQAKVQEMSGGTGKLSPSQVDALKNEIDVNFGKLSTDATELNLNQKAGSVRRAFDRAVDASVPGYKEINDHLADLHHANDVLTTKIKENAEAAPFTINPKSALRGVMADALSPGGPKGTRPGLLTTPGRTALAAALSKAPNIPSMPNGGGMTAPPAMEAPVMSPHTMPEPVTPVPQSVAKSVATSSPPAEPIAPDLPHPSLRPAKVSTAAPKLPVPPTITPAEEHAQLITKRDAIIKEAAQNDETPNITLKEEAAKRKAPRTKETAASIAAKPTHVQEGSQVSGLDEQGNLVSGSLEKLYPMVENGKPVWKGTILDIRNSRTVDIAADRIFDKLSSPPKNLFEKGPRKTANMPAPPEGATPKKSSVQEWLDKQDLDRMEESMGAGKPSKALNKKPVKQAAPEQNDAYYATDKSGVSQSLLDWERRRATKDIYSKHIDVIDEIDAPVGERYRIDELFDSKSPAADQQKGAEIYDSFAKYRKMLKQKYGNTIKLVRLDPAEEPRLENKTVLHWWEPGNTDEAAWSKDPTLSKRPRMEQEVPIDDIVAAPDHGKGKRSEFIVLNRQSKVLADPVKKSH